MIQQLPFAPNSSNSFRLTNTLNRQINPADLVESQVIRYKSFDGMTIPALYGFSKKANEVRANKVILDFLNRYLKKLKLTKRNYSEKLMDALEESRTSQWT